MKDVYLAHDDQDNPGRRLLFLENAGYQVTTFESSERCLQAIQSRKPAILLADILLIGMNGFELCRRIRQEYAPRELPVILSSELYRSDVFIHEARECGAQRYLLTPYKLDTLLRHVNVLTGMGTTQGEGPGSAAA